MGTETDPRRCLLIAMPQLQDPNFSQTTSLLSEFNQEGAMGLVLNRPLNITLDQLLSDEEKPKLKISVRTYWGGPVQNQVGWILHEDESLASESLLIEPKLFLTSSPNALQRLVEGAGQEGAPRFRFYLGYAGWGQGQLEQEMAAASWVTTPINRDLVFDDDPSSLWARSLQAIGVDPMKLSAQPQTAAN